MDFTDKIPDYVNEFLKDSFKDYSIFISNLLFYVIVIVYLSLSEKSNLKKVVCFIKILILFYMIFVVFQYVNLYGTNVFSSTHNKDVSNCCLYIGNITVTLYTFYRHHRKSNRNKETNDENVNNITNINYFPLNSFKLKDLGKSIHKSKISKMENSV